MIKILLLLALVLPLSSCAEFRAAKMSFVAHAEEAADEALDSASIVVCRGSTVGAVKRKFKTAEEKQAYNAFCDLFQ